MFFIAGFRFHSKSSDIHYVTVSPNSVSTTDKYVTSASTVSSHRFNSVESSHKPRSQFVPTIPVDNNVVSTTPSYKSSSYGNQQFVSSTNTRSVSTTPFDNLINQDQLKTTILPPFSAADSLSTLLRREGLFAMAKYLTQSGLDHVLNETGMIIFFYFDK